MNRCQSPARSPDAELGIERIQHIRVDPADLAVANERPDVLVHIGPGAADGALSALVVLVQVSVKQLADRRAGPRVTPLADLGQESAPLRFGVLTTRGPGGMTSTRSWRPPPIGSSPGVHAHAEGTAGRLVDASLPLPGTLTSRHERRRTHFASRVVS